MSNIDKDGKRLATAIIFDTFLAFLFWQWQARGSADAGSVFIAVIWTFGVLGLLVGITDSYKQDQLESGAIHRIYQFSSDMLIVGACAWVGYYGAAVVYLLSALTVASKRKPYPDQKEASDGR